MCDSGEDRAYVTTLFLRASLRAHGQLSAGAVNIVNTWIFDRESQRDWVVVFRVALQILLCNHKLMLSIKTEPARVLLQALHLII